jgi:PAS domain S-box-containing protein
MTAVERSASGLIREPLARTRSTDLTERLFTLSPDLLGAASFEGFFTRLNPSWERVLGWTSEELMAEPFMSFVHPDDVEKTNREAIALSRPDSPSTQSFENRYRTRGGDYRSLDWTVVAADGLLYFVAKDVTERKIAEADKVHARYEAGKVSEALESGRGSVSFLASLVDSSVDAIISKTLDGTITSWNLGAERMYGYAASEVIDKHISLLFPPDHLDELEEALTRITNGGLVEQHDTQRICKDGSVLDVSVTIAPIHDRAGRIIGASAIGRNITTRLTLERERRVLEARLNQSERLESMGRLAGGIAHDFNNLLAVILNYATFVREELNDEVAAAADLNQITAAAERASALTRQLLAFARREVMQPKILNLNDVVTDLEQILRRTISEQVDLGIELSKEPWSVEADPGQLEQVLVNLVVNARDAMPGGGAIHIDTENVTIDLAFADVNPSMLPGHYVRLRISDTGSGMEKSVLEHVFEPFFTTKPQGEGTGLGLPMVFGIVRQAGGDIQIYSEVGIGTTVSVFLPATDRAPTVGDRLDTPRVLRGSETVLVVEDEDALREVTRRILARNGYQVLTSANGPEAIALIEEYAGDIDLLLTDVIMPYMVGKEVAERVRQMRPGVPVLFMSGYAQPVLGSTLGEAITLLEKPFSENLLLAKVRDVMEAVR